MTLRLFTHYWHSRLAALAFAELALFASAPFMAASLRFGVEPREVDEFVGPFQYRAVLYACVLFTTMAAMGLYHARQRSRFIGRLTRITAGVAAGTLVTGIVLYFVPQLYFGRGILLGAALISVVGSAILRTVLERVMDESAFKKRVLIFGSGNRANSLQRLRRRSDRRGFLVVGYLSAAGEPPEVDPALILGGAHDLVRLSLEHDIDEIVIAMDDRRQSFPMSELLECRMQGVEVIELSNFLERETGKVRLDVMHPSWMIFSDGFRRGRFNLVLERIFDVGASLVLLACAFPVMLLTVFAIKLESGWSGTIFYRQIRVGQGNKPFSLMKFRSMREDAEKDGVARWADKNDSRVTRVGAFIRKTRIDELPQVFNVLKGEMSFVGPRPERPEFVSQFSERIPYYSERHSIKPGITGWAQLCYPYGASDHDAVEKLQYDLYYVKNHSPLFYLAILVQTVEIVIFGQGAR